MADVAAIRQGIADNLTAAFGPDVQVSAYMLAEPTPPAIHVFPGPVEYDQAFGRGLDELTMRVQAFVALVADQGAQINLDKFLAGSGAYSVKAAIEADRTLGGACHDAHVTAHTGYQQYQPAGGGPMLMAEWTVLVRAEGA